MDMIKNETERRHSSVLQGDGFYFNRILSRESSVGQSSQIYYRRAEGVPFEWEMQPGTPKNLPGEETIPPLSPPPSVQSMRLPTPCVDHQPKRLNHSKGGGWFWKKIKIIHQVMKVQTSRERATSVDHAGLNSQEGFQNGESDGEFIASLNKSCSSSSSSSSSSNTHAVPVDGPFCCSTWNITAILDEGNRKVYYCRDHNAFFALENDGSFPSKIPCRVSSVDQSFLYNQTSEGIPFKWEMQPGRPKDPPENEIIMIPPPSPPPAIQSLALELPKLCADDPVKARGSTRSKIWLWIKSKKMHRRTTKIGFGEVSFRVVEKKNEIRCSNKKSLGELLGDSFSRSSNSSSTSLSKSEGRLELSKFRTDSFGGHFCFNIPGNS